MGITIYILLLTGESIFLFWRLKEKSIKKKEKSFWRIGCSLILCLLLIAGVLKGLDRYGILIAALLLPACFTLLINKKEEAKPFKKKSAIVRLAVNSILYLIALLPAFLFPQYKPLPVTGDLGIETAEYTYVDESRIESFADNGENRSLTVKFWYPDEEGSYPLVIFSHGAFGVIDSNYSTYAELASHGYVVASIGHPYHAMYVRDVNGKMTFASKEFVKQIYTINSDEIPEGQKHEDKEETDYRNSQEWLMIRTGDMNFVLDTIIEKTGNAGGAPFSMIDKEKIGLFGHSLGGAASVQTGRERKDIDAVIDLEGSMLGEYIDFENGAKVLNQEPYPIPLLDVNSRTVHDSAMEILGNEYVNFYVGQRALNYREVIFNDAGHLNFTDLPVVSPPLASLLGVGSTDARECIEDVNHVVLTFFDHYLKGEGTLDIEKEY